MPKSRNSSKGIPAWAILSKAEARNLSKPEPARKHMAAEEDLLLKYCRKLGPKDRQQVFFCAHSLALARIRERLERGRRAVRRK